MFFFAIYWLENTGLHYLIVELDIHNTRHTTKKERSVVVWSLKAAD